MPFLISMLTIFLLLFGSYTFAANEEECPEGQVFDKDLGLCVIEEVMDVDEDKETAMNDDSDDNGLGDDDDDDDDDDDNDE